MNLKNTNYIHSYEIYDTIEKKKWFLDEYGFANVENMGEIEIENHYELAKQKNISHLLIDIGNVS
jgi:hypothetical protein